MNVLTFDAKPYLIWIYCSSNNTLSYSPLQKVSYDWDINSNSIYNNSILIENVPENFTPYTIIGTGATSRSISKYTRLGGYAAVYQTSNTYVNGHAFGWVLSIGRYINNTY